MKKSGNGNKKTSVNIQKIITNYISPLSTIIVAIAMVISGFLTSSYLKEREAVKARTDKNALAIEALQIYSGLMSKRQEEDSVLRESMFNTIIQSFSETEKRPIEELLLNLKLLAYNFSESFNMKPFFLFLRNQELIPSRMSREKYLEELENIAQYIITKQLWILKGSGKYFFRNIDLDLFQQKQACLLLKDETFTLEGTETNFKIAVLDVNTETEEIKFMLEIRILKGTDHELDIKVMEFWVGPFDFPMIDNIRLSHDQRCAIVLDQFSETAAHIAFVIFPGTLAGIKERPYYQEAVQYILETGQFLDEEGFKESWSVE